MASVQDLKRRIRSIRNTRKITKAMELVASARLRRAQVFKHLLQLREQFESLVARPAASHVAGSIQHLLQI